MGDSDYFCLLQLVPGGGPEWSPWKCKCPFSLPIKEHPSTAGSVSWVCLLLIHWLVFGFNWHCRIFCLSAAIVSGDKQQIESTCLKPFLKPLAVCSDGYEGQANQLCWNLDLTTVTSCIWMHMHLNPLAFARLILLCLETLG